MKQHLPFILVILFLVEVYSLLPRKQKEIVPVDASPRHYLSGAIHVESNFANGTGAPPQIAEAAKQAGLDFVVLTDQNTSQARAEGMEKSYDNVDLFVEMETTNTAGHSLVFYSHTSAKKESDQRIKELGWNHFLGKETTSGLFTVVAHPSNLKSPWNSLDRFPDGVEVINFDSSWRRQIDDSILGFGLTMFTMPFSNYLAGMRFDQLYRKDFSSWDAMNAASPGRFGILAHNTEANFKIAPGHSLPWPDYRQSFRYASNIVFYEPPLSHDFEIRKAQIYRSIKQGKSAMVFQFLQPFAGNDFTLQCADKTYRSGDRVEPGNQSQCRFVIHTPPEFPYPLSFQLWRDGELVKDFEASGSESSYPLSGSGTYRLEVWAEPTTLFHILMRDRIPYVLYNPIYVR